jgi:hypothetical protein
MRSAPTKIIVGGLLLAAVAAGIFLLIDPIPAAVLVLLLAFEGWTLIDPIPGNTISEQIWAFSRLPLVPFLFGSVTVLLIAHGIIPATTQGLYTTAAIFLLMGHFFFPKGGLS